MIILIVGILSIIGVMSMAKADEKVQTPNKKINHPLDPLFIKYAQIHGVKDWLWLKAIAKQESDLGANDKVKRGLASYDGKSYGLMQIAPNLGSAKEIELKGKFDINKLNNDEYSIDKAAQLVAYLQSKYYPNRKKIFLAYNQGEKNTDKGADYSVKHTVGGYGNVVEKHYQKFLKEEGRNGIGN